MRFVQWSATCLVLAACLTLTGCPAGGPFLAVSTSRLEFAYGETEKTFEVWNRGTGTLFFEISAAPDWLTVDPTLETSTGPEDKVTVTVTVNDAKRAFFEGVITIETPTLERPVLVTTEPDYYTQTFAGGAFDLDNKSITFTPDGGHSFYGATVEQDVIALPTDPTGGADLLDSFILFGDPLPIPLQEDKAVLVYGHSYDTVYVGSDGYLAFGWGAAGGRDAFTLDDHFDLPGVSGLFADLDPHTAGAVTWQQLEDRIAVTYEDVTQAGVTNSSTCQIEMFFDGDIRLTFLDVEASPSIVGLSVGYMPDPFTESDLSSYAKVVD